MNIGDRVRLLHGNEEGTIRKISSSGRIEVEIEDGFIIPAQKQELVLVHESEKKHFGGKTEEALKIETPLPISAPKDQGLYLAFVPINDQSLSLYLINDSHHGYLAHTSEVHGSNHRTLFADKLQAGEAKKFDDRLLKEMDEWPAFLLRFIPIQQDKNAYVFALEQTTKELDIRALNQDLNPQNPKSEQISAKRPAASIDLHIEQLVKESKEMSNSEILRIQLEAFEKNLDQAIASGMDQITFIHGIGNGVLRKEIHKRLSQIQNIKYFQDTQKDNWGYGATLVRIS
jgi:hypothetical protein